MSSFHFPFIQIENRNYPTVILGEDNFTGWFGKGNFSSEKLRKREYEKTLEVAYNEGVRGFSISPHQTLIDILKQFKRRNPDIVCIANPHYKSHYYIKDKSLWEPQNFQRLNATALSKINHSQIQNCKWFESCSQINNVFSEKNIKEITLNKTEYNQKLKEFAPFCDFSIVGNIGKSTLLLLNRQDIIQKEIQLTRNYALKPIGICEAGGIALEKMKLHKKTLDLELFWLYINKNFSFPSINYTKKVLEKTKELITAYRIFGEVNKNFCLNKHILFFKNIKQIKSLVVGVENHIQAKNTFSQIKQLL